MPSWPSIRSSRASIALMRRAVHAVLLALVVEAPVAARAQTATIDSSRAVTTGAANLRAGPSTGSTIIARLAADSTVHVDACYGDWCAVQAGETLGYVFRDLLRFRLVGETDRGGCRCLGLADERAAPFGRTGDGRSLSTNAHQGHSGFHASIGVASGQASARCVYCFTDKGPTFAPMVRLGIAVTSRAVVSGEVQAWTSSHSNASWINVVAQYYVGREYAFFIKGGGGAGAVRTVTNFGAALQATNTAFVLGLGYDMHVSRGVSITAYADYLNTDVGGSGSGGGPPPIQLGADAVHAGLAVSWR